MPIVMIKCPQTGKPLDTGMDLSRETFAVLSLINQSVPDCPHCGQRHRWSKPVAWLANTANELETTAS